MLLDSDRNRLLHMIEASSQALEYAEGRIRSDLDADPPLKHLLIRNIEIVGEAASRISQELRVAHPEVPWRSMVNTRNRLIHAYFDIDLDIVWSTIQRTLPELLPKLKALVEYPEVD